MSDDNFNDKEDIFSDFEEKVDTTEWIDKYIALSNEIDEKSNEIDDLREHLKVIGQRIIAEWKKQKITEVKKESHTLKLELFEQYSIKNEDAPKIREFLAEIGREDIIKQENIVLPEEVDNIKAILSEIELENAIIDIYSINNRSLSANLKKLVTDKNNNYGYDSAEKITEKYPNIKYFSEDRLKLKENKKKK